MTEGDNLKLSCSVLGGRPAALITWRSFDVRGRSQVLKRSSAQDVGVITTTATVANNENDEAEDKTTTTLVLNKRLTRDDLNTRIECHVEHEAIRNNSLDSHVLVDVNGKWCRRVRQRITSHPEKCHALVNNTNLIDPSPCQRVPSFSPTVGIKTMELIGPQTSIREGSAAYIECIAYGSKPAAEIVWRNG